MTELDKDVEQRLELAMVEVSDWFNTDVKVRNTIKQFLAQELASAKEEGAREALSVLDKAELENWFKHEDTLNRWKTWKRIRNTIVNQLTNPSAKEK